MEYKTSHREQEGFTNGDWIRDGGGEEGFEGRRGVSALTPQTGPRARTGTHTHARNPAKPDPEENHFGFDKLYPLFNSLMFWGYQSLRVYLPHSSVIP